MWGVTAAIAWCLMSNAVCASADEGARAVATALLAHDKSIDSIEYEWECHSTVDSALSLNAKGVVGSIWALGHTYQWVDIPDMRGVEPPVRRVRVYNGVRGFGWYPEERPVIVAAGPVPDPQMEDVRIEHLLGRQVDWLGGRRLGELLLACPDLRVESVDGPLIRLSGLPPDHSPRSEMLRVTSDSRVGFAPVRIESWSNGGRDLLYEVVVTRHERHADVWIPVEGVMTVRHVVPMSGDHGLRVEVLRASAIEAGMGAPLTEAICRSALPVRSSGEGAASQFVCARGSPGVIRLSRVLSVNQGLDQSRTSLPVPDPAFIIDNGGTRRVWRATSPLNLMDDDALRRLPLSSNEEARQAERAAKEQRAGSRRPRRCSCERRPNSRTTRRRRVAAVSWLAAILGIMGASFARDAGESASEPRGPHAMSGSRLLKVVDADAVHLGALSVGATALRRVTVTNVADEAVLVRVLGKSCGCLAATSSAEQLQPDDAAVFSISTVVAAAKGLQEQSAEFEVEAASGVRERFVSRMTYSADASCTATPDVIRVWGVAGQPMSAWWVIASAPGSSLVQVTSPACTLEHLGARVLPVAADEPLVQTIQLHGVPAGPMYGKGTVSISTSDVTRTRIDAPVIARVADALVALPGGVVLQGDALQDGSERSVRVRLVARPGVLVKAPLTVRLEPAGAPFACTLERTDREHVLTVRLIESEEVHSAAAEVVMDDGHVVLCRVPIAIVSLRESNRRP